MPNANATHAELDPGRDVRDLLFKQDRPRTIDRFIDFFGDSASASQRQPDPDQDADDLG